MPSLLRTVCVTLLLALVSFQSIAVPIPINSSTKFASTRDSNHGAHLNAHAAQPPQQRVQTGAVQWHGPIAGETHHFTGTVQVDPRHQQGMRTHDVHAVAAAAKQSLAQTHPHLAGYEVHAHHTPGDAHVQVHASPPQHHAPDSHHNANHAVRHPGPGLVNSAYHRLPDTSKDHLKHALDTTVFPNGRHQPMDHHFAPQPVHVGGHPTGAVSGHIPAVGLNNQAALSAGQLQGHAEWVHRNIVPAHQKDKVHVHVTHNAGDATVGYRIAQAKTARETTHQEIQDHLTSSGNTHYQGQSITHRNPNYPLPANGDHGYTFKGTIPAHTREKMTPDQLSVYAHHARNQLIARHGLTGVDARGMVVAATHKEGDTHVQFSTQPKTQRYLDHLSTDNKYPQFNNALHNAGHYIPGQGPKPFHHAELGALRSSLDAKGANSQTFAQHLQGHVIGIAGAGDQPCQACHNTLARLGGNLEYAGMNRPVQ